MDNEVVVNIKRPHPSQELFINSLAKRKIVRAGRRSGKTTGAAILAIKNFLNGRRILYATPTEDQITSFWLEVKKALGNAVESGIFIKNETKHVIELPLTKQRIRAKTAYNADTLRGDSADILILDEFQLMNEDTWGVVGAPMLLDNNGDAVFIYTPPSLHSRSVSKADDKRHAAKMYQRAEKDKTGRWQAFHFTSHDNPHISPAALSEITQDMTARAIRQEINAEDIEDIPGALWTQSMIDGLRVEEAPELVRIVVAIDPSAGSKDSSDEAGIIVAGISAARHGYVIADGTKRDTPHGWALAAINLYRKFKADRIVAEKNNGGEMVEEVLRAVEGGADIPITLVWASRGKVTRAEPVSALYEHGKIHHVGTLAALEEEMTGWVPGDGKSPNRVDALVWAINDLGLIEVESYGETVYAEQYTIDSSY